MIDWSAVNAGLLTIVVILLGWMRTDIRSVVARVDEHLKGHS